MMQLEQLAEPLILLVGFPKNLRFSHVDNCYMVSRDGDKVFHNVVVFQID